MDFDGDPEDPDLPPAGEMLWTWFFRLSKGRANYGYGAAPLTWADLEAWMRITGVDLSPLEADALLSMDNAYISALAATKADNKAKPAKTAKK